MGVLNVTPDSFYDGGRFLSENAILSQTEKMLLEGADFIDIGGYSSRPGADDISVEEERRRAIGTITAVLKNFPRAIPSVDTFRSEIAEAAVDAGASLVNDISAGNLDPQMLATVARLKVPYIAMHMRGNPRTMAGETQYTHLITELVDYFHQKISALRDVDLKDIIIDPGFGFSKTIGQNFHILHHLEKLSILGRPILVGLSRKSMIWKTLEMKPDEALNGTTALNSVALLKGADIIRVHDVKEARELVKLFTTLQANVTL